MKINIAASHRFHLLDLARELTKQGHDVRFYSYVPTKRCVRYGLKPSQCTCLLPYLLPFLICCKIFPKSSFFLKWRNIVMDFIMSHFMRRCDVYICLGVVYLKSISKAKNKFGAVTILEWGSKHIDEQQRILASINSKVNDNYFNERSRKGYELADYISVASKHVVDSFLKHGYPEIKIFRNPYGVNLSDFYLLNNVEKKYDVIMVGGWSLRKGCDLITEAIRQTNLKLLHIGGIVDLSFPKDDSRFTHIDPVDQKKLVGYYNQAKVFILPSREEGLAMVQAQAIACNLPLIGSRDSGAEDLMAMVEKPYYITLIDDYTPESVAKAMIISLRKYKELGKNNYAGNIKNNLTWEAYGKRYSQFLLKL